MVVSETSSRDRSLGPITPASLELAEIAMIALSTSATVPWIYAASVQEFRRVMDALQAQHLGSSGQVKQGLGPRCEATSRLA